MLNCRLAAKREARTADNVAVGKGKGMAKSFLDDNRIRRHVGRTRWAEHYQGQNCRVMKKACTYWGQRSGGSEGEGVGEKLSGRQSNSPSRRKNPLSRALPRSNYRLTEKREARTVDNVAVGKGKGMAKSFLDDNRTRRRVGRTRWIKQYEAQFPAS